MAYPFFITLTVGVAVRLWLIKSSAATWLAEKTEVVTPLTSWKRVTEGLALHRAGISPYAGDIFHETPLMLRCLHCLTNMWGSYIFVLFVLMDVMIALSLERIAKNHGTYLLQQQASNVKEYSPDSIKLLLSSSQLKMIRLLIVASYLFNPYTIATCVAQSTAIFNNLWLVLILLFTLHGNRAMTCLSVAVATYLSLYPIMLVVPAAVSLAQHEGQQRGKSHMKTSVIQTAVCTLAALATLLYLSFMLEGSWAFLRSTYGFIITVPDLTPNIGVFWYFFTEMFEHFRLFFICVFQINALIYTVPLTIKLREHPIFLMFMLLAVGGVFKSYPSYGDTALYMSLIPLWRHVLPYTRNSFVVCVMLVVCSILAPILWHLWIYSGSANANFYFAITLVLSTAQIFLITDLLFAFLRREYDLRHGTQPPVIEGKPAQIILD